MFKAYLLWLLNNQMLLIQIPKIFSFTLLVILIKYFGCTIRLIMCQSLISLHRSLKPCWWSIWLFHFATFNTLFTFCFELLITFLMFIFYQSWQSDSDEDDQSSSPGHSWFRPHFRDDRFKRGNSRNRGPRAWRSKYSSCCMIKSV